MTQHCICLRGMLTIMEVEGSSCIVPPQYP